MHSSFDINSLRYFHELFLFNFRYARKQNTNHGKTDARSVRALPIGCFKRRLGRGDQQEVMAGDHEGSKSTVVYHKCSFHAEDTVSDRYSSCLVKYYYKILY